MRLKNRLHFIISKQFYFFRIKIDLFFPFILSKLRQVFKNGIYKNKYKNKNIRRMDKYILSRSNEKIVLFDNTESGIPSFVLSRELDEHKIPFIICNSLPDLSLAVDKQNTVFIGISCYYSNINAVEKIIKRYYKTIPLVFGGPQALQYIDFGICCYGGGEETIIQLYRYFKGEIDIKEVANIQYKENGIIKKNIYKPVDFSDKLPIIRWPYLLLSRGCFHKCAYCAFSLSSRDGMYFYDIDSRKTYNLIKESLKNRPYVIIADTTVTPKHKKILEYLNKEGVKIFFTLELQDAPEDFLEFLSNLKDSFVHIGVQSLRQESLKAVNRKFNEKIFLKKLKILRKNNLPAVFSFIIGLPHQTKEDIERDINFVKLCNVDGKFYPLRLIYGTKLKEAQKLHGYKTSSSGLVYESKYFSQEEYKEMFMSVLDFYYSGYNKKIPLKLLLKNSDMYEAYEVLFNNRKDL